MIIAFILMSSLGYHAYTLHGVNTVSSNIDLALALLYLNGAALSLDVPLASLIFFVLAAVVSRFAPADPQFHHHRWALFSLALAIASFFSYKKTAGKRRGLF